MKRSTISPWLCLLHGNYRRVPQILVALCVIVSMASFAPAYAVETGIRGTVLWGPVKPGPSKVGQDDEAPLRASFAVFDADNKVVADSPAYQELTKAFGAFEGSIKTGDSHADTRCRTGFTKSLLRGAPATPRPIMSRNDIRA